MLKKLKWIVLILLVLLVSVLCLQNWASVRLQFLFKSFELPQTVVLLGTLLIGMLIGLLAKPLWRLRAWRTKPKNNPSIDSSQQSRQAAGDNK